VFAVESHLESGDGAISVRDAETFAVLETFPTYGAQPHDCVLIDRGKTLAITNGGGPLDSDQIPCVTFVHIDSRKLLEKHEVTNPRINTGHIAVGKGHDFAVVSAPRHGLDELKSLGGVSLRTQRKPWEHITEPARLMKGLVGETLSVVLHDDTVVTTTPHAGVAAFWSLHAKSLKRSVHLPDVRGVTTTLDGRYFLLSFAPQASLAVFDTRTLERVERDGGSAHFSGSHLYTWAFPA
jgi:hypothetical protein